VLILHTGTSNGIFTKLQRQVEQVWEEGQKEM
jgi:hypothetical protein